MLQSYEAIYDHGQIKWVDEAPPAGPARVVVTLLDSVQKTVAAKLRQPSPKLRGTVKVLGDLTAPLLTEEECSAFSERTARQLEGDPKAFEK